MCHWQTLYVPVRLSSPYNHEPVPSSFQALFIIGVCVHLKVFVLGQHNACWAFLIARKTFSYLCVYSLQYGRRDSKQQCPVQTIFFFLGWTKLVVHFFLNDFLKENLNDVRFFVLFVLRQPGQDNKDAKTRRRQLTDGQNGWANCQQSRTH